MGVKTIKNAVKGLPEDVADHIVKMFTHTGYLDLYEGNLKMYLGAIEQNAERTTRRLFEAWERLEKVRHAATIYRRCL